MSLRFLLSKPALHVLKSSLYSNCRRSVLKKWRVNACQVSRFCTGARHNSIFVNNCAVPISREDLPDYGHVLETWHYDVVSYGQLIVRSAMPVHVQSVNPQLHPSMNKLFVTILYVGERAQTKERLANLSKQYIVTVDLDENNEDIDVTVKSKVGTLLPTLCHIQIPLKYDVSVTCDEDSSASLQNLDGENIQVNTFHGSCTFKNIKSLNVHALTIGGDIIGPSLIQGNISLESKGNGNIMASRLQGQTIGCHSNQGQISVKAIYAQNSIISSKGGNIHLGSCHGNTEVMTEAGNLAVDSMDGNLTSLVRDGSTKLYMVRDGVVNLATGKGDIDMKVSQAVEGSVSLTGTSVDTTDIALTDLTTVQGDKGTAVTGQLGRGSSTVNASTGDGSVKLSYQDWFSSLNLGGGTT